MMQKVRSSLLAFEQIVALSLRLGGALAFHPGPARRKCKIRTRSMRKFSTGHVPLLSQEKGLGGADLVVPPVRVAHCQRIDRGVKKSTVQKKAPIPRSSITN